MSRSQRTAIPLTTEEAELVRGTTYDTDLEGSVRRLFDRATTIPGGLRLSGTDDEIDQLLGAIWVEIRGYQKLDEERLGRELLEPRPGTTAGRLATIYDKIEQHLS